MHDRCFRVLLLLVWMAPLLPPASLHAQDAAAAAGRIGAVDESSRVILRGNRHPLATPANDRGEANPNLPMERMLLVLKRDPGAQAALDQLLAQQQDPSSPNFHAWLTPAQFGARFGPAQSDLQKVAAWLESHGFRVSRIAQSGMLIEFDGTAGQVKQAFHTPIHSYFANGKAHFANALDPQIPSALAPVVAGISTLHNFVKRPALQVLGTATRIRDTSLWQPDFTFNGASGPEHFLAPGDFAKIYNTAPLYSAGIDGTGQSIAIVARTNINLSDMQIFRLAFGLPPNKLKVILDGPDPGNLFGGEEAEADLDAEWSGATAPNATINLVVSASTNTTDGVDLSAQYIVDNNLSPVMSASFMQCEASLGPAENTFFNNLWEQAAAQGITVVVASGDNGPAGCDSPGSGETASQGPAVNGLASTPFNIAVGGTQFNENGADSTYWSPNNGPDQSSVLGYIPENVWNESCSDENACGSISLFASGGGPSSLYSKPPWQAGPGVPNDPHRDLPDVALAAAGGHDGYLICQDGICLTNSTGALINAEVIGGTSAATPTFAAIMALVVQKTGSRQGQANFVIYPLAAGQNAAACNSTGGPGSPQSQCIFNDITQGNNSVPGQTGATAASGYDLATGWGSVNAANLVSNWTNMMFRSSTTNLQISPASVMHGQPVTASATVAPQSGAGTPTGEVALLPGTAAALNLGPLANGSVSSTAIVLPGGSYSVTAAYGGDGTFSGSTSTAVAVTVSAEPSTTALSVIGGTQTGNPPTVSTTYSAPLEFQAAVVGASGQGNASGMVTISDMFNGNSSTLAAVPLNIRGVALVPSTALAIGTHMISASYAGDASFQSSNAGPVAITVGKGPTETFLFLPSGALPASSVTLEAFVIPVNGTADPSGTVQFLDGNTALGNPVPVKNLLAVFTTNQLSNGSHSITAAYSGDSNFLTSTSPAGTIFVGNPDFQIAANPGFLTVSSSSPAASKLLLSPGPGLGFTGNVSFSCAGLPASVTCSFAPSPAVLDGFSVFTDTVTFTKTSAAAAPRVAALHRSRTLAAMSLVCVLLVVWPRKPRNARRIAFLLLLGCLAASNGCGGGSSSNTIATPPPAVTTFAVAVTATGGAGNSAVTHSVTLGLTVQ